MECLLSISADFFVFYFAVQKRKDQEYRTITLSVVLNGRVTWSLTLREERGLIVFENWVLRGVFGCKRNVVTGEWRKLHNEWLNNLYCLSNILVLVKSRRMRWVGHEARMGRRGEGKNWWKT
jgi:hypothetical protein